MGEAESREKRMQSVPSLHQHTESFIKQLQKAREPLFRRDPNILDDFDRQERKQSLKSRPIGDLRLKKVRELMKTIRQNDQENQDIQDLQMRPKKEERSGKKSAQKECLLQARTLPVMGLVVGGSEAESRGRKFKVSRML